METLHKSAHLHGLDSDGLPLLNCLLFSALLYAPLCVGQTAIKSNLPIVVINTSGVEIPDADKIPATFKIVKADVNGQYAFDANSLSNTYEIESDIGIEIRGNSSIHWEKKSYGIEMRVSPTGDSKDVGILGMPMESDWILNACYGDKSFLRDVLAHEMYRKIGTADHYSPRSRYVEVYMKKTGDMTYRGVYILMEKIKKSDERINVKKLAETDSDPAKISGGYIVQIGEDEDVKWSSDFPGNDYQNFAPGNPPNPVFHVEYPKLHKYTNNANKDLQLNYIKKFVHDFEAALAGDNFKDAAVGYRKYINVDVMIDYLLHEEFVKNSDNWRASAFFYKNRDGLLTMGAPWDFDRAMGNQQWCYEPSVLPTDTWAWQYNQLCDHFLPLTVSWPKRLLSDCYFKEKLIARYSQLRSNEWSNQGIRDFIAAQKAILMTEVNGQQNGIEKSAIQRNFRRWDILTQPVMNNDHYNLAGNTYDREVQYLQDWLMAHLAWMDANISSISSTTCSVLPVTFNGFDVKMSDSGVIISWSTVTEQNNERFDVERSGDGRAFARIGSVAGNLNSSVMFSYALTDPEPLPGISYYRIRQQDIDGTFAYTAIKAIENKNSEAVSVVYPNPVKDEVYIRNMVPGSLISIFDHAGRKVKTIGATERKIYFPVSDFQDGLYQVQIQNRSSGYQSNHRIMIVK